MQVSSLMSTALRLSPVEQAALQHSPFQALYPPTEKLPALVVENFPALGRLAALRFLEWTQHHPGGVVALPTGKTPEHFIRWVQRLTAGWETPEIRRLLEESGIDPSVRPDLPSLHFVQIDEFYPISPTQHNSFCHYVSEFYLRGFGLDPGKALLMDCTRIGLPEGETLASMWPQQEVELSLRYRPGLTDLERRQKVALERIDQWCQEYEDRIRALGGIGFFLGGIGPDGHIGFNVRGSDHHSTTRLTATNYETQAAAATDLGGIEVSRKRLVITIGLGTIAVNPDCVAIIIAAGEAKAGIVADAIQHDPHVLYPATSLHKLPQARFYLTLGAAKHLQARQHDRLVRSETVEDVEVERVMVELAVQLHRRILDLRERNFTGHPLAAALLQRRPQGHAALAHLAHDRLVAKVERGVQTGKGTTFLHTEPHHDDLMLGYLPYIVRHVRDASNTHFFACLTSGFTAVTNHFMIEQLHRLLRFMEGESFAALLREDYFEPGNLADRNEDVWRFLDGVAAHSHEMQHEGAARRFVRDLVELYQERDRAQLQDRVQSLLRYFDTRYPGQKDDDREQRLKGMRREFEAECLWGYLGWSCANVLHLRLGFYQGDIFTEEPTFERDAVPVLRALERVQPDVVSVALDPEASGPDTHYKVLQCLTAALKEHEQNSGRSDLRVWGYRNVWYRFHPSEANVYVPVSLNMLATMHNAFMNTFLSQKAASFPSPEHDGPFSELAWRIQVDQYQKIQTCLGREWFYQHPSALIRAARGLVFLREMTLPEFYACSRSLMQAVENR